MTSSKRVLKFLVCFEVNITHYRRSVGIINDRNFAFTPIFTNFIGNTCQSTNHLYFKLFLSIFTMNLVLFLVSAIEVLLPRCGFYITSRSTYTSILVITVALLLDYLCFKCNLLLLCLQYKIILSQQYSSAILCNQDITRSEGKAIENI